MQYFTGSKEHNVKMRQIAIDQGYSLSEYSLKKMIDGGSFSSTERKMYTRHLGMEYIPPELREDSGRSRLPIAGKTAPG
jgi:DNA polymerase (family 10)